uniref:Excision repair cross-complementation group 6-like 2 n=1 Tax=Myripristis murdjan TaxID=586833 RepID=A0A667X1C9_9TELE
MASTSTAEIKATWRKGDTCLAPRPRDGILREATIKKLISASNSDDSTAMVVFTDQQINKEDEEEEEEAIPVSKLLRSFNTQEKPLFPSSLTHPGTCVPLELSMTGVGGEKVPYTINRYLRDYQREGIRFIYSNYMHSRGSVLGDDMGLGKTVQVIGFLAAVLHKTGTWEDIENNRPQFVMSQMPSKQTKPNRVFLIVAPLSVLYNWKDELDTWGHFQCVVVHGLRKEEELARIRKGRVEIALTTYETLRLCLDQFNSVDWSAVIVDEAHKIKNPNSQITQAMKDLKCQVRIGLTVTAGQNDVTLWKPCVNRHFKSRFSDPIEKGQRYSATKRALATGRKTVRALVRKISCWFLRRTKTLIKDQLPKKNDRVVYCSLTDFQQTVYQTVLDSEDVKLLLRSSEKCDCESGRSRRSCCYQTNSEGVEMKTLYFSYLAILRKVSNHVALLQSTAGTSKNQEKYVKVICEKVFQKFPDFVQRCKEEAFEAMSDPMYSGKMKVLQKLLNYYMQRKDKVLLFSLSTKLLDVLENYCMAEGLDYSRLDGATKSKERVKIVKDFNSCPHTNLCLVSTMAGGLGLNFVGANVVVLFDPTWNPANDLQAIDRAYRIGQYRDVTVLRLISLGTVEEVIYLRQVYKQQLQCSVVGKESARRYFEAVQGSDGHKGELFGIKNLFRLQTKGTCLTRKILEVRQPTRPLLDASEISRGVLDFSSGSEDDEEGQGARRRASDPSAVNGTGDGNTSTASGRMSLLQHGFSRLLQQVEMKPGSVDGDSSQSEGDSMEGSISEEDREDLGNTGKREGMPSGINKSSGTPGIGTAHDSNSRTNNLDIPSSSEQEGAQGKQDRGYLEKSDDTWRERPGQKEWIKRKTIVNEESDENSESDIVKPNKAKTTLPRVHQFESYSDESEDLDIEAMTRPMMDGLNSRGRGGNRGRERSSSNRKRKNTATTRNQARTKYSENIEAFTSSEEEYTPVKRESRGCHFTSPRTEGFRHNVPGQLKEGRPGIAVTTDRACTERKPERPSAVSFTALETHQATPITKGVDATIDSGVKEVAYTHSNQRVVGGSKAEERMTRAAVRDVFQRKMYSQIPANLLVGTQEVRNPLLLDLSQSPPNSPPHPAAVRLQRPSVDHPVTFTSKTVHHTRNTSFIIGETPRAVCRYQEKVRGGKKIVDRRGNKGRGRGNRQCSSGKQEVMEDH